MPVSEYEKLKKLYVDQQEKIGYWYSYPKGLDAFGSKHLTGSNTSQKAYVFKPAQKMKIQMVIALYNTSQSYEVYPVLFDFTTIADSITAVNNQLL